MNREKTIITFGVLGDSMMKWGEKADKDAFNPLVAIDFYEKMETTILSAKAYNGWFTEESVRDSLFNLGKMLTTENLNDWIGKYSLVKSPKRVGLILAGNIPLVGFHDVLSVVFSGNNAKIKMSSSDDKLIPLLLAILYTLQPELKEQIELVEKLSDVDAVIATGSDNTARYFEKYFGHLPNIIRKNRTSVAIIDGSESKEELEALGNDVFSYFGMGCRNVSHLVLPKDYDLDQLFGAFIKYGDIIHHHKYGNNYDYYRAIYLMNQETITENGFVLTRETEDLFAPVAMLHYHFYEDLKEIESYLKQHEDKIQVVIGKNYTPFGTAQAPRLEDYADNIDTMAFLSKL